MGIIKIGDLEVKTKDFGQVEYGDIYNITMKWEDGWRIPTKEELNIIYDYKIKHGQFEDKYYWSSNRYIESEYFSGAWVKHFGNGCNYHFWELFPAYVLCVRSENDKEFFKNGIVVLHFCNRIELLQFDFGLVGWKEAENIVKNLGDDWRIPTIKELEIIKPYKRQIAGIGRDYYWGVSTKGNLEKYDSYYFGYEIQYNNTPNLTNNLIVVRSEKPIDLSFPVGFKF